MRQLINICEDMVSESTGLFRDRFEWDWLSKHPGLWTAEFESPTQSYIVTIAGAFTLSISFTTPKGQAITGDGYALKVLGTVKDIIEDVLSKKNPETFGFEAKRHHKSRVRLYDRLAPLLAKEFGYNLERDDTQEKEIGYYFSK